MVPLAKVANSACGKDVNSNEKFNATIVTQAVGLVAQRRIEKMIRRSKLQNSGFSDANGGVAAAMEYSIDDFHIEKTLGEGSFGQVSQVRLKQHHAKLPTTSNRSAKADDVCTSATPYYALKCLNKKTLAATKSPSVSKDKFRKMVAAYIDLATEAHMLGQLDHENIVKLYGVHASIEQYFFIMDVLHETLRARLHRWRISNGRCHFKKEAIMSRIEIAALGVVKAMEYLHSRNIIFQDLKPENIGFDADGKVKLFDFGLAREVHMVDHDKTVGSLPYIAPECCFVLSNNNSSNSARSNRGATFTSRSSSLVSLDASISSQISLQSQSQKYSTSGLHSDIYSFGILLWEICTLRNAFDQFKCETRHCKQLSDRIKWRPSTTKSDIEIIPSQTIETLITNCWHANPKYRPTFNYIKQVLESKTLKKKTNKRRSSTTLLRRCSLGLIRHDSVNGSTVCAATSMP